MHVIVIRLSYHLVELLCVVISWYQLNSDCFPIHAEYCTSLNCHNKQSQQIRNTHNGIIQSYLEERQQLIQQDTDTRTGQDIVLSPLEEKANQILMAWKHTEMNNAYIGEAALPAQKFVKVKSKIEQSQVFKIIQKMPKGAVLHIHDMAMAGYDWLIQTVTTKSNCYICFNVTSQVVMFKMASSAPEPTKECNWISAPYARNISGNPAQFDAELLDNLTMMNPEFETQNDMWKKFMGVFMSVQGLIGNTDVFRSYYYQSLKELLDDNVQYVEVRALLIPLYDLAGNFINDPENTLKVYKDVNDKFVNDHYNSSTFYGSKIIYTCVRRDSSDEVKGLVKKAMDLKLKYPDFLAGFDLVGQEDAGHPLIYFLSDLLLPDKLDFHLPYIFHAGETDWEGAAVDYNIADAILLNSSRIGHGFAFTKHPKLMEAARKKNIAVEVSPISNQVLGLVSDLRNHPASVFLSQDFPMTVTPDDPAIWNATGVSFDFYEVFMGMSRIDDDLRLLKRLAMNSIRYSSLNEIRKKQLMIMWQIRWEQFIKNITEHFSFP